MIITRYKLILLLYFYTYMAADRKERGKTQQLYLVERKNDLDYLVMGSTGNIYSVSIQKQPQCTCPDYKQRKKRCKHIYFVLLRIMKVKNEDQLEYSDADLIQMIKNIPEITKNLIVNKKVAEEYKKIDSKTGLVEKNMDADDLCPICLDDLNNGQPIDYCKFSCGKCIHEACLKMWIQGSKSNKCLFCTQPWTKSHEQTEYVNLGKMAKQTMIIEGFDIGDFDLDDMIN